MTGVVEMTMEEWKKTSKNYKGRFNGERHVLKNCGGQGTCMVPVKIIKKIV
jgi:hypothetical protein